MSGNVVPFQRPRHHARASTGSADFGAGRGRGMPAGHAPAGQLSENHCIARSSRKTLMPAPVSSAASFLPSSKAREETVDSPTCSISAYAYATESSCLMASMPGISVSLPGKSTAILPSAAFAYSGHSTGMDLTAVLTNIEGRLAELGMSADKASRLAGRPDAIRNLRRAVRKGKGGLTMATVAALARALKTTQEALLAPAATVPVDEVDAPRLREFLVAQRNLIDRQIQALDARQGSAPKRRRSANR